nr:molybdopterin dinucleotide binding domain-containing protein [Halomicroarcula amylolytica]
MNSLAEQTERTAGEMVGQRVEERTETVETAFHVDEEFPLTLTSRRVLYHWHLGQITRRIEGLSSHVDESFVEINLETAEQLGVIDGEYARVESRRGFIAVKAQPPSVWDWGRSSS